MRSVNIINLCTGIVASLFSLQCDAKALTKYYGPAQENLIGTIKNLTFPGPPNYQDIQTGDRSEACPYLILDHPIDVVTKQSIPTDDQLPYADEKNTQFIQLAIGNDSVWPLMKDGRRVKVKGMLYEAHNGHHHTRILMLVDNAKPENSPSNFDFNKIQIQCEPDHGFCEVSLIIK